LSNFPADPAPRRSWRSSAYGCQFVLHDSPVHRMGAGWKIGLGMALSALAAGVRTPGTLLALVLLNLGYYFAARLTLADLWRDIRLFLYQAAIVIPLYCLMHGVAKGLWPGIRISVQIILFYIPGAVFLRTTRSVEVMKGLRRVIPYRLSFLVFVSVRFVPFFLREMADISAAQRLRGARLLPLQQLDPRNWSDLFHCLLLPLMVRALKTADEVSLSAEARGFGLHRERTFYDPESAPAIACEKAPEVVEAAAAKCKIAKCKG
jgi:energy-coupling factor transport system permease protein